MFGSTVAWGLDIGSSTIKAVKLQKTGSGVQVVDFDVIEIEHSDDESTRDMRNAAAIAELVRRKKFTNTPVVVSVPGNQVFFRPFSLPAVGERKVNEIVRYEARQQVPFPLEEVVWDYRVATSAATGELAVSLVAIRKEIVERLLASMREHELNIVGLAPSPVAVLNYVQYDVQPMETCLILDSGAKVTDFVILQDGSFWFRPLPVAGDDITHVFEQKFRMPYTEAENLKTKLADSKQYEKMFQVLEPTLRSMAGEIQRTSGYYLSLQRNVRISRVFGLGHTFRLPGMLDFLSQNIEMEVEVLSTPRRVQVSGGIDTTWFAEEFPGMGPAMGLALQGLGQAQVEMQLLPPSLVKEQQAGSRRKLFTVAAAAIVALVACQYFYQKAKTSGLGGEEGLNQELEKVLKTKADMVVKVAAAGKQIPTRKKQLERWAGIGAERGVYSGVIARLLDAVEGHNRKMAAEHRGRGGSADLPPAGEVLISDLLVTRKSPGGTPGFAELRSDVELRSHIKDDRADGKFYVVAKFECRGRRGRDAGVDDALRFEDSLHKVPGFASVRKETDGQARKWFVRGDGPEFLPHITDEWRQGVGMRGTDQSNAWVFTAVWLFDAAADAKAAAAAVAEAPAPAGGNEK
ncbi:MAG: pilus assembly protein PilM [Planctomycetota bacterium]|jgi:type IV pilus assembly protein PilM